MQAGCTRKLLHALHAAYVMQEAEEGMDGEEALGGVLRPRGKSAGSEDDDEDEEEEEEEAPKPKKQKKEKKEKKVKKVSG